MLLCRGLLGCLLVQGTVKTCEKEVADGFGVVVQCLGTAEVYRYPVEQEERIRRQSATTISATTLQLGLADFLGVSSKYSLGSQEQQLDEVIWSRHRQLRHAGLRAVIQIDGLDTGEVLLPRYEEALVYKIRDAPSRCFDRLGPELVRDVQHVSGVPLHHVYSHVKGGFIAYVDEAVTDRIRFNSTVLEMVLEDGHVPFNLNIEADQVFASEITALKTFILQEGSVYPQPGPRLTFYHFISLQCLRTQYGVESQQYATAMRAFKGLLEPSIDAAASHRVSLVVIITKSPSTSHKLHVRDTILEQGEEVLLDEQQPIKLTSRYGSCFESEEACQTTSNNCSDGHGKCVAAYGGCWHCQCQITRTGPNNLSSQAWGGDYCQKKDVTVPFHLIFWFVLFLSAAIGGAIAMLASAGGDSGIVLTGTIKK